MKLTRKAKRELRQLCVYAGIITIFVLIILLFNIDLVQVIASIMLIIFASLSKIYKRITSISFGFELVTLSSFIFAYRIGIFFSVIATFLMLLFSAFIAGKLDFPELFMQLLVYTIVAVVISIFSSASFIPLAITMIFLRIILLTIIEVVVLGLNFIELGIYIVTNTFLNIIIIMGLSNYLLGVI